MTDEALTPDAARGEIAAMRADPAHPVNDLGHFKHLDAVDRLQTLLGAIDGEPTAHPDGVAGEKLEALMDEAMPVPETPEEYDFSHYDVPADQWDAEAEAEFRQIFHRAGLSQPEVSQLLHIASSDVVIDPDETLKSLTARYHGDEARFQTDLAVARAAIRKVGGQGLADYLVEYGLADSLQVFDLALRKGKEMGIE